VLLLDRDRFPRDKPCAGWITPAVLEALRIDPLQYRQGRLLQEIREFRTSVLYGRERRTDYGRTVSYGIRRTEFDQYLLQRGTAPAELGEAVESLERIAEGWLVNGRIRARLLVGAGGHGCPVARVLGARPDREPAIAALVTEFELGEEQLAACRLSAGHTALSFCCDGGGYGWLLRKGSYLNLGLGSLEGRDLERRMAEFCAHLQRRGELPGAPPRAASRQLYLPYRMRGGRRLVGDRALLIGDAAGLACPESGKGILPAVESAIMAAQTILCASGDYRPGWLQPYADAVAARYGSGRPAGGSLGLQPGAGGMGGRALLASGWAVRHLVLDRWFLRSWERPLVPKAEGG